MAMFFVNNYGNLPLSKQEVYDMKDISAHCISLIDSNRRDMFANRWKSACLPFEFSWFDAHKINSKIEIETGLSRGEVGCFRSHIDLIIKSKINQFTFIFEDDSIPLKCINNILPLVKNIDSSTDIVFLSSGVHPRFIDHWTNLLLLKKSLPDILSDDFKDFHLIDANLIYNFGMTGYVITPMGSLRLKNIFDKYFETIPSVPIDMLIKNMIKNGIVKGAVIFPFVNAIDFNSGTHMDDSRKTNADIKTVEMLNNLFVADFEVYNSLVKYIEDYEFDKECGGDISAIMQILKINTQENIKFYNYVYDD
jgi:GR25 family glycosyltransferase involved in LPS biosynthesis